MRQLAVSAIGRDRPGIVAAVARSLLDHGLNIEDSQMGILRGHFTMVLIVSGAEDVEVEGLRGDLEATARELGLEAMSVNEVDALAAPDLGEPTHIVTVYGADHPGIVHAIASALAERGANITDLQTRLVDEEGESLYVMMLEVAVHGEAAEVEEALQAAGGEQGVEVTVRELESDAL
jgi:glycine cleavage system transcriptional repressor